MHDHPWLSAYGEPYDPRPAIEFWRAGQVEDATQELWDKLYHQGTVNSASYAAVGEIVMMMQEQSKPDWSAYSLVASIEEARLADGNPPVPSELKQDYENAWAAILPMALRDLAEAQDDLVVRGALAVVAHAKGQHTIGTIALLTEDERVEMLGV
ncbi:hypothetical protein [Novosphingobium sediminicola]|uniref:Uncharacterized protein n=1 Tax=Novosphingobium sediminicola TaxID=563162 RepID=A0A7W6CS88_9SPHN|nr:hypothetical protein [Novosphingobium sediminicola]MBB3956842.1 hypothetical protein [Novosphingobium sediminicola]